MANETEPEATPVTEEAPEPEAAKVCGKSCGFWEQTVEHGVIHNPPKRIAAFCKLEPDHEGPCWP